MYIFCYISATLGGIFLELSILNSYVSKCCQFGSNRSLIKGTLLGQQCIFWLCTSSILNPGGARFSTSIQTSPGAHPASYIMCNTSLSWGKVAVVWRLPPTTFRVKVNERVELYLYSPLGLHGLF
jgi:hypothetical protein